MDIKALPLEMLITWLRDRRRFALVRFGDGEFACLQAPTDENCDGVRYSPAMAQGLLDVLDNADLVHGILPVALHYGAEAWLSANRPNIDWWWGHALTQPNMDGQLWPLHELLWQRRLLYIGPERIQRTVQEALYARSFVPVPLTTAFDEIGAILKAAQREINHYHPDLVGVSAGPAAKIIIHRLAALYPAASFWDMGSEWDMYAGYPTRSGPKRLTNEQIDDLAYRNFHWQRIAPRLMPWPSVHDLLVIPGLISESEALFLYDMALLAPPGLSVELGTYQGRSAAILARAAQVTGARVLSIDNYSYEGHPPVGQPTKNLARFGLAAIFRVDDSCHIPPDVQSLTLLYVDSDHMAAHVQAELDAWLPLLGPGGVIIFHDYGATYPDVAMVVNERMVGYEQIGQERRMIAFRRVN